MLGLRNRLFSGLLCLAFSVAAQNIHKVKMGETLYSVSKKYGMTIAELVEANEEANHGLKMGMELVIPQKEDAKSDTPETFEYKLRLLESFYSLKKKFGVEREELIKLNPELEKGFRAGKVIRIPKIEKKETIIIVDEAANEEYAEELKERNKKKDRNIELKDKYQLSYLLPFYLDINDSLLYGNNPDVEPMVFKKSSYALDFYTGSQIALDKLEAMGLNADVFVFDTENSRQKIASLSKKDEVEESDLVIGPFYTENVKMASNILKSKRTPIVVPLSKDHNLTKENKNLFQVQPSTYHMLQIQSQFIQDVYGEFPITVIRRDTTNEKDLSANMTVHIDKKINAYYKEFVVQTELIDSVTDLMMDSTIENQVFIIPSNDRVFVSDLLTKLNKTRLQNIVVFTSPAIRNFKNIDADYLSNLNVHFPDMGTVDYSSDITQEFISDYRKKYGIEPEGRYAFIGFDITYYFGKVLLENGKLNGKYYIEPAKMTNTSFDFNAINMPGNGYVNYAVSILKYQGQDLVPVSMENAKKE